MKGSVVTAKMAGMESTAKTMSGASMATRTRSSGVEGRRAEHDEEGAHDQRAEDPPEEHPVPEPGRDREDREDHEEHEDVVDRQRLLDHVAGRELEGALRAEPEVDAEVEDEGEEDPEGGPGQGLPDAHGVGLAVEDAEIERQHGQHEGGEADPRGRGAGAAGAHRR